MNIEYSGFRRDLEVFQEMTGKFYNKEISMKEYKGFSGRYGSYAQRGQEKSMLRLRMTGGRITMDKLKFIVDSIQSEHINQVHFTTCQAVQFHNLEQSSVSKLMLEALEHEIVTWGGGGDYPRNVMMSPLSGVEKGEHFDVSHYAQAAEDYLLSLIDQIKLPRKLKVAFANSPLNEPHVTFRDLGFMATSNGTFDVYSAGGLGNNPKMGICVEKDISPSKILYYIKAMIDTFIANGNYESRGKSRTRYMQDTLGEDGYIEAFHKSLSAITEIGIALDLPPLIEDVFKKGTNAALAHRRIIEQKQPGLYAVSYHPIGGTPPVETLSQLYHTIKDMKQVELRLTPDQGVYIINCNSEEAQQVLDITHDGAETIFESSVACIGASICQIGIRDSQKLLNTLVTQLKTYHFADGILPQIHISGCPSSCGTHQIGQIGFHGGVKMIDKTPCPAFTLHINGASMEGLEKFGEQLGVMLESDIPLFLAALGETIQVQKTSFDKWLPEHLNDLKEIALPFMIVS
ncbi:MAG: nitrite/sulfite reductase [Lachnospiraceae bacterium]